MAGKKHAVARRSEPRAEVARRGAPGSAAVARVVARLDLAEQRYEMSVEERAADVARIDQKLDQLREVLAGAGGITDQREAHFLRRMESMRRYGAGELEAGSTEETWVERDLAAEVPRGALAVASAWGISRDLIEQVYAQYQSYYEAAFRRWREKYPAGVAPGRCHACGHALPESKPLPRMEER